MNQFMETVEMISELVAERMGREKTDMEIQTFSGALIGAIFSSQNQALQNPRKPFAEAIDEALAFLEAGLPLR